MLPQSHMASSSPQMQAQFGFQNPSFMTTNSLSLPIASQSIGDVHLQPTLQPTSVCGLVPNAANTSQGAFFRDSSNEALISPLAPAPLLPAPLAASITTSAIVMNSAVDASSKSTELAASSLAPHCDALVCSTPTGTIVSASAGSDAQIVKLPNGAPLLIKGDKVRVLHRTQSDGDDQVFLSQGLVISPSKGWARSIESVLQVQNQASCIY